MTAEHAAISDNTAPLAARDLNPNRGQLSAADPAQSVWVSASAGSGKTKVLTDRILRLLLPRSKEQPGSPPHKIMALTFTKAAASEMKIRLAGVLAAWAVLPLDSADPKSSLRETLSSLLGRAPQDHEISAARKLLAQVIDAPGGLQIMTIHSFCQSVLGRFPLEAGLSPGFKILEERQSKEILNQAKAEIFAKTGQEKSSPLAQALRNIAGLVGENDFMTLLSAISSERRALDKLRRDHWDHDGIYTALCRMIDLRPGLTEEAAILEFCQRSEERRADILNVAKTLTAFQKNKREQNIIQTLSEFIATAPEDRFPLLDRYISLFLTGENKPRAELLSKDPVKNHPDLLIFMQDECARIEALLELRRKIRCADAGRDLFLLADAILHRYGELKAGQAALDFTDLILKTRQLLENRTSWVMFKLDQGIDHILIDEAQDTNPEQWDIIRLLSHEFFDGAGVQSESERTVFVVGDEKQSIYSFQRASPEEFRSMRSYFYDKIAAAGKKFEEINLNTSFRSARSILKAVDLVFSQDPLVREPGFQAIAHHAFHDKRPGHVEIWPPYKTESAKESENTNAGIWQSPAIIRDIKTGAWQCAEGMADLIAGWMKSGEILAGQNRPIRPGDIMVLVKKRGPFVHNLIRALKYRGIPVSGHDRMILESQIAVQDLVALMEFALAPADDLNLACLLKSPFIGLSEDSLYKAAQGRKQSLWQSLQSLDECREIVTYLHRFIHHGQNDTPFDFLSRALYTPCPAAPKRSGLYAIETRLGVDALDPVQEFLNTALDFTMRETPRLQDFLAWLSSGNTEIKRDQEEAGDQVRIMTIHGSKGLQAPIVFLPDTLHYKAPARGDKNILWPHKTGLTVPLWAPAAEDIFGQFRTVQKGLSLRENEEYHRLLYVAMTRAAERLYVMGFEGKKPAMPESWYHLIVAGLKDYAAQGADGKIILHNAGENPLQDNKAPDEEKTMPDPIQEWMYQAAPAEPSPPRPLVPSRPSEMEPAAMAPYESAGMISRFRRGNLTHRLLQFLPDMPQAIRAEAARRYLQRQAGDLDETIRQSIAAEVMAILDHPDYAAFFAAGSMAETPISGYLPDGRLISGQIDRLCIGAEQVHIIDFKTNRPPPDNLKNVPDIYRKQLQAYRDILAALYPDKAIISALLWTDGPRLMVMDDGD